MTRPVTPRSPDRLDLDWMQEAACAGRDVTLFYVPDPQHSDPTRERRAKAICRGCEVRPACLDWALATDDRYAVLGGTSPDERKRMRRRRTRKRAS